MNLFMTSTKVSKTSFQKKCCVRSRQRQCRVSIFQLPPGKNIVGRGKSAVEKLLAEVTLFMAELDVAK